VLVLELIVYMSPVLMLDLIVYMSLCSGAGAGFNCLHEPVLVLDLIVNMSLCWYWI
jgi:hypothetical protein